MSNGQLVVKEVEFNGATLLGAQAEDGKVYVGAKWICQGIGLSEGQSKNERLRLKEDMLLSQGGRNFVLPTNGGLQETQTLDIEFLPMWLAKISITPKMLRDKPEVAERLLSYQLKAKDVLAQAFIHQPSYAIESPIERAKRWIQEQQEKEALLQEKQQLEAEKAILLPQANKWSAYLDSNGFMTMNDAAKILQDNHKGVGRNILFEFLRYKGILMNDNTPYQKFMKNRFKVVHKHNEHNNAINSMTLMTTKGFEFIADLVKEYFDEWKANRKKLKVSNT